MNNNIKRVCSLDIGNKNFCIYIEDFDISVLHSIKNIPKSKRYNKDNTCSSDFRKLLNKVYKEGNTILLEKADISTKKSNKTLKLDRMETLIKLTNFLDKHKKILDTIDIVLIEQQVKNNYVARYLEQHCFSYFVFNYLNSKIIIVYPAKYKTQILGMKKYPKNLKDYQKKKLRKDWSIEKSLLILKLRNDINTLDIIESNKKKDDYADTITMLQSFKYLYLIDKNH